MDGDSLRMVLFLAGVVAVYFAAARIVVVRLRERPAPRFRAWEKGVLALAALGLACMAYGRLVEPRWLEVNHVRVPTSRLPPGHRGVRLVHLSDLHSEAEPLLEPRLAGIVAGLHPDAVVFTGDAANEPAGIPVFRKCLAEIAAIAPTFAVKGNWDAWYFTDLDRFGGTGAMELDGAAAEIEVEGTKVRFAGCAHEHEARLGPVIAALPADGPLVVLNHYPYPDVVPAELASRVDLLCAGHVHGGQLALPFFGALVTLSKYGKRYERGLYEDAGGLPMYVSRGIGMEGGAPRVRFCSRPEVTLIELVPQGASGSEAARRFAPPQAERPRALPDYHRSMEPTDDTALSRLLSLALRHRPADFGLTLDPAGWTDLEAVVAGLSARMACDAARVARIVATSDKRRFELSADGRRIRAVQGHSVRVELGHPAAAPPPVLYHGTVAPFLASILATGLAPRGRHDVHLSSTIEAARSVGARRGKPVVLRVDSAGMACDGHVFRLSPNGVWLCREVPPQYLGLLDEAEGTES